MARSQKGTPRQAPSRPTIAREPLYLVRRLYEDGWDSIFGNSAAAECSQRSEWGAPIKAFTERSRAEALGAELSNKLLEGANPFDLHGSKLADFTSFPPGPFRDWLLDVGLKPLPAGNNRLTAWSRWWKNNKSGMSAEQRHRVLAGLDKLRLYAVVELELPANTAGQGSGLPPVEPAPVQAEVNRTFQIDVFTVELLQWKDDDDFLAGQEEAWMISVEPCFYPRMGICLATFRERGQATGYQDALQRQVPQEYRDFYRDGFGVTKHPIEVED
jgi:hypothetical protein